MCTRFMAATFSRIAGRAFEAALGGIVLTFCGCATIDAFGTPDSMGAPPTVADPNLFPAPSWCGVTNVFGTPGCNTPPWISPSNVFGTPAWAAPPSVYGTRLHVPPGESAAAKVLKLTNELADSKVENEQLANRIRGLEADVDTGNQALARATREINETRTELANTRRDLEQWKQEIASMREKLDLADKDSLSTLQTTVGLLQQMLANEQPPAEGEL